MRLFEVTVLLLLWSLKGLKAQSSTSTSVGQYILSAGVSASQIHINSEPETGHGPVNYVKLDEILIFMNYEFSFANG